MPKSASIIRGCGVRKPGGLYVCSGLSPVGQPLGEFIIDPPIPYEGGSFRTPIVFEREGKKHLLMWVGQEYYPFCSDFIEEARRYGVSKRIPDKFPIEEMEEGSMLFLVHPGAFIEDYQYLPVPEFCPKGSPAHLETKDEYCLGHVYTVAPPTDGFSVRKLGSTEYTVHPVGMAEAFCSYKPGIFLRVPITHFDHIMTRDGRVNPAIAKKRESAPLPVIFEKE